MKLIYKVILRASVGMAVIMVCWAVLFYFGMTKVINDEIDDMLSEFSEQLIVRFLSGEPVPLSADDVTGQYELLKISEEVADELPQVRFEDKVMYIYRIDDHVASRVMKTIFYDRDGQYYQLTAATPSFEKEDIGESLVWWTIALYALMMVVSIVIYVTVFYRCMRPFYVLIGWLDAYKIGQANRPLVNPTDITEFARLNDVAVRTMRRNEQIYEQQRQFTGNASHELQTPIAICINRMEMLMEDETLSPQQMEAAAKVLDSLGNLQKLNKSMLLLSRIDSGQFPETEKNLSFRSIIDGMIDDYRSIYSYKEITLEYSPEGDFHCDINSQLAATLVANLLKNAFVHSDGGKIIISLSEDCFSISNGPADEPLDAETVFQRFAQGKHRRNESSGLGLAIVKSICGQFGLSVRYGFSGGFHTFLVRKIK